LAGKKPHDTLGVFAEQPKKPNPATMTNAMIDPSQLEAMMEDHEPTNGMGDEEQMDDEEDGVFAPISAREMGGVQMEMRRVPVPAHRLTPLRDNWMKIYQPVVEHMKLQIRFNPKRRCVEIRVRVTTFVFETLQCNSQVSFNKKKKHTQFHI
jgi:hypothetical protein